MPPPINTAPDRRASNRLCFGFINQARPRLAARPQPESSVAPIKTDTTHITGYWCSTGKLESMNCGRNAVKNAIDFGLVIATTKPRQA
jgi:hypothetical protein